MIKNIVRMSLLLVVAVPTSIVHHAPKKHEVLTPKVQTKVTLDPILYGWDTSDTDKTASWPDRSDPLWLEPRSVQRQFACIRYHESRNHLTSVNIHSNAQGWYQFMPYIWQYARENIAGLPTTPNGASGDQQSKVALWYYHRNNGINPQWSIDNC